MNSDSSELGQRSNWYSGWRRVVLLILGNLLVLTMFLALLELFFAILFRFPPNLAIKRAAQAFHLSHERESVMWLKRCARHNTETTYRLHPNVLCNFKSREYEIDIKSNSIGVRDDEESLEAPEVVMLGDSHLFGWGVSFDKIFASRLEKDLGVKVLNTGIPSFSTVREMRMFNVVDTSNTKYLTIQYCDNDLKENEQFHTAQNTLKIMRKIDYDSRAERVARGSKHREYYFGKFTQLFFPQIIQDIQKSDHKAFQRFYKKESRLFYNVLRSSKKSLAEIDVIVFEIASFAENTSGFVEQLKKYLDKRILKEALLMRSITIVDFSKVLTSKYYFTYDDHMNPEGHKLLADTLSKIIKGKQPKSGTIRLLRADEL